MSSRLDIKMPDFDCIGLSLCSFFLMYNINGYVNIYMYLYFYLYSFVQVHHEYITICRLNKCVSFSYYFCWASGDVTRGEAREIVLPHSLSGTTPAYEIIALPHRFHSLCISLSVSFIY